jgi:hypothetical protein
MMNRSLSVASPIFSFTALEIHLLDQLAHDKTRQRQQKSLSANLTGLAPLRGYLARRGDSPPGNRVI